MSATAPAKVYVVIYTVYHHVHKLAVEVQKGLNSTGVSTKMFQGTTKRGQKKKKKVAVELNVF